MEKETLELLLETVTNELRTTKAALASSLQTVDAQAKTVSDLYDRIDSLQDIIDRRNFNEIHQEAQAVYIHDIDPSDEPVVMTEDLLNAS